MLCTLSGSQERALKGFKNEKSWEIWERESMEAGIPSRIFYFLQYYLEWKKKQLYLRNIYVLNQQEWLMCMILELRWRRESNRTGIPNMQFDYFTNRNRENKVRADWERETGKWGMGWGDYYAECSFRWRRSIPENICLSWEQLPTSAPFAIKYYFPLSSCSSALSLIPLRQRRGCGMPRTFGSKFHQVAFSPIRFLLSDATTLESKGIKYNFHRIA